MAMAATGSAIVFHLTRLGIALTEVGDSGELFTLAVVVVVCSLGVLLLHRQDLPWIGRSFIPRNRRSILVRGANLVFMFVSAIRSSSTRLVRARRIRQHRNELK